MAAEKGVQAVWFSTRDFSWCRRKNGVVFVCLHQLAKCSTIVQKSFRNRHIQFGTLSLPFVSALQNCRKNENSRKWNESSWMAQAFGRTENEKKEKRIEEEKEKKCDIHTSKPKRQRSTNEWRTNEKSCSQTEINYVLHPVVSISMLTTTTSAATSIAPCDVNFGNDDVLQDIYPSNDSLNADSNGNVSQRTRTPITSYQAF